jgi:probable HAF family extracellular repeat protein
MYHTNPVFLWAAAALGLLISASVDRADAAPLYALTNIGTLGGTVTIATDINSSGQVTGYSTDASGNAGAFLYSGGSITPIGSGGCCSVGLGINDYGQVVGTTTSNGGITYQAAQFAVGSTTIITPPSPLQNTSAVGISNVGQIAVTTSSSDGVYDTSYVYENSTFTNIGSLGGPLASAAISMNSAGIVTGYSGTGSSLADYRLGFEYQNGILTNLGNLGGSSRNSIAYAANSAGVATGTADNSSRTSDDAFFYSNGTMTDLGQGCGQTVGTGINNFGVIVGIQYCGADESAILYQNGTMFNLNDLIDPSDPLFGSVDLAYAAGITDSGLIAVDGCVGSTDCITQASYNVSPACVPGDQCEAFLLSPVGAATDVPEPSSLAGFGAGFVFLGILSRRVRRLDWPAPRSKVLGFRCLQSSATAPVGRGSLNRSRCRVVPREHFIQLALRTLMADRSSAKSPCLAWPIFPA